MKALLHNPVVMPALILCAMVIAVLMVRTGTPTDHAGAVLPTKAVETLTIQPIPFRAQVRAFGNVEPSISLNAKAQVSGNVSYRHPELKQGGNIAAGTVVLRIDPTDYQVSLKQTEADLAANKQSLIQLEEEEKTTHKSLAIAKENLSFGEQEFARIQKIWEERLVSRSTLDSEKQKVNQLRQSVDEGLFVGGKVCFCLL